MNILVIGLGSMGKRRIRLIRELFPDASVYGVDGREDRRDEASSLYGIYCKESVGDMKKICHMDAAFVCTSPLSHNKIIAECLQNKWNVFTELNLVSDGYDENRKMAEKNGCKLFLSSTFLYREEIKYIRSRITENTNWNYVYHVGQYLPDWHPWENYKDFFVGDKRTNGCREIMAIELPWIINTFGKVTDYHVVSDKISNLHIDYKDNYIIQFSHENGNKGVLIVDIVSPVAVRSLEIYGEYKYLRWDGTPYGLYEYDSNTQELHKAVLNEQEEHREEYRAFIVENAYKNEIKEFFDIVFQGKEPLYGFAEDMETLKLIDSLEEET